MTLAFADVVQNAHKQLLAFIALRTAWEGQPPQYALDRLTRLTAWTTNRYGRQAAAELAAGWVFDD